MQAPSETIADALQGARARLEGMVPDGLLDAERLLAHLLGTDRAGLFLARPRPLDPGLVAAFRALVERRRAGEPLPYLLGRQGFLHLDLHVDARVLVPRPETEGLVERALDRLRPAAAGRRVLDLGTGSGAIALALLHAEPGLELVATDASPAALAVAAANRDEAAGTLGLNRDRLELRGGDWYEALHGVDGAFDVIVSNPPYVAESEGVLMSPETHWEPREALFAGADGLTHLRRICAGAPAHLRPGGWLLVEHGFRQGEAVRALLRGAGFATVTTIPDLSGHPRVTEGRRP